MAPSMVCRLALVLCAVWCTFDLAVAQTPPADMTISQINLHSAGNQSAKVVFSTGSHAYSMEANSRGWGVYHNNQPLLHADRNGQVDVRATVVNAELMSAGDLRLAGVYQFRMVALDMFSNTMPPRKLGYNANPLIQCGGNFIATGRKTAPKKPSLFKVFRNLPKHDQIRITATVHFIDDWQGETAYLKADGGYAWTSSHDQRNSLGKISVCGSELYPESKFAETIDLTIPHNKKQLTLAFGTTLPTGRGDDAVSAYFGLSSLAVYVRTNPPAVPVMPTNQPTKSSKDKGKGKKDSKGNKKAPNKKNQKKK